MADIVEHAVSELRKYGKSDDEIMELTSVIQVFADLHLPDTAVTEASFLISELLAWRNLTQITDDPSEWVLLPGSDTGDGKGLWQNIRNPMIFSMDGGKNYYSIADVKAVLNMAISAGMISRTSSVKLTVT